MAIPHWACPSLEVVHHAAQAAASAHVFVLVLVLLFAMAAKAMAAAMLPMMPAQHSACRRSILLYDLE